MISYGLFLFPLLISLKIFVIKNHLQNQGDEKTKRIKHLDLIETMIFDLFFSPALSVWYGRKSWI